MEVIVKCVPLSEARKALLDYAAEKGHFLPSGIPDIMALAGKIDIIIENDNSVTVTETKRDATI